MSRRIKVSHSLSDFVPTTINFSELEAAYEQKTGEEVGFEASDDGIQAQSLEDNLIYDELVVQVLFNLYEKEKIIFAFQLLRDSGFQISHELFAKSINMSRRQYMRVLDDVRLKVHLMTIGQMLGHK